MSCATCPIPKAGCMTEGVRMPHTTCVSCGKGFTCEGDIGATYWDPQSRPYPVCHPQDCDVPTEEHLMEWNRQYRPGGTVAAPRMASPV